jgi:hypothetical protein
MVATSQKATTSSSNSHGGKSNPFGAAKPREQVLQQRGVDIQTLDDKFEKKSKSSSSSSQTQSWSSAQKAQVQAVRLELTRLEALWREANEKELPEEVYRQQAAAKRDELNQLLAALTASTTPGGLAPHHHHHAKGVESGGKGGRHHLNAVAPGSPRGRGHYEPTTPLEGGGTTTTTTTAAAHGDAFAAMSRHRFGTTAN